MTSNEETNAAGTDTRLLVGFKVTTILEDSIHRSIRANPLASRYKSIQNGPTPHPMITDPPLTDSAAVPAPRKKLDSEFSEEENKLEMADTQAEIILSQDSSNNIFKQLIQTSPQRRFGLIWRCKCKDQYERFRAIGNESIHDYFVRFHKLVNDMKITQLNIPTHQMNTKFVNNLPAYWGKYVTNVKQNMDISTTPCRFFRVYTHLKAYEPHAKKTLKKQEQSTSIVDPLAYVAHTTSAPALSSPSTLVPHLLLIPPPPPKRFDGPMTLLLIHLKWFQKQFPPPTHSDFLQHKDSCYGAYGLIVTEPVQRTDSSNKRMRSLKAHSLADVECTTPYDQPQALTTTNMFQANHEDAVWNQKKKLDEGPMLLLLSMS
ncbi:hypothetical protein Tco_0924222 [Tanacetum coccineum]|uniref:Uncharacterized protein n=1 Tax=Tanacetum coccineum TaxID=301880 RepID=A0ABQ5D484_9ASTR